MLRIGLGRIQLLNVRPCHALAAGDAVLQIDVFFMGFQSNGIELTGILLINRCEQTVF